MMTLGCDMLASIRFLSPNLTLLDLFDDNARDHSLCTELYCLGFGSLVVLNAFSLFRAGHNLHVDHKAMFAGFRELENVRKG